MLSHIRSRKKGLRYAAGLTALMMVLAACGGETDDDGDTGDTGDDSASDDEGDDEADDGDGGDAGSADAEVITIGMPVPTSGPGAAIGNRFVRAGQMAVDELNAEGDGSVVFEAAVEDSECGPDPAATSAQNLIQSQEVDVLIGELCSSATLAVKDVAEAEGVPLIVPNSSARAITDPSHEWTFRIIPHEYHQHEALARVAVDYFDETKIAVMYEQTDAGIGARDAFIPEAESLGAEIVLDEAFDRAAPDFTPLVNRIQESGAEALHLTVLIEPGVRFVQAMQEQGLDIPVYSSIWFAYPLFEETAGSAANNNVRQLFYINSGEMPEAVEFTDKYNEQFPDAEVPDFNHAQYYAAVKLVGWAVNECGATDRESIRDCLREVDGYRTPIGPITFDEEGQVIPTPESLIHIQTLDDEVEVLDKRDDFDPSFIYEW